VNHALSERARLLRKFPPGLQLCQILFFLVLDIGESGLKLLGILVQIVLRFLFQFSVQLPPVLGIARLMGFVFPVGYIALDEIQPDLTVPADDLGRVCLDLMLQICVKYLGQELT
jgi:hypothetical protein